MRRLFFASIFFFGVFFFVRPPMVNAAVGDSCIGENMGFRGTCQTSMTCDVSRTDSSPAECPGLICCDSTTGAPAGATPQSVCVGKSQDDPCIGPTFNEPGTCRAVPTASSPLSCVVNTGGPSTGGTAGTGTGSGGGFGNGSGSGSNAGGSTGTVLCDGVMRSGICFPTGTGLSSAPVGFLLMRLMSWLLALFGMIAIIAFVISGMQYLISAGNEDMIETAKRNMQYSIIGVLVGLSGWVIIRAIDQALGGASLLSTILCLFGVC